MQVLEQATLFTEISDEQAAEINGGYYYQVVSYRPCSCYNYYSYGTNYNSYGYGYNPEQATVVNVYYYY